ncbi:MAG: anti-sigma F factor [Firmicutes bacterium]|nr:anti-sigma F factor [Bacillota bacterium]
MKENYLHVSFPSLSENVSLSRVIVASFAAQLDFTLNELEEIRVATSEAVSNCVIHAYPDQPGEVRLELKIKDDTLMIKVIDEGCGIEDLELARTPAYSSNPERMGLGLVFMESFMDEMTIESQPQKGTQVLMVKRPERSKNGNHDGQ